MESQLLETYQKEKFLGLHPKIIKQHSMEGWRRNLGEIFSFWEGGIEGVGLSLDGKGYIFLGSRNDLRHPAAEAGTPHLVLELEENEMPVFRQRASSGIFTVIKDEFPLPVLLQQGVFYWGKIKFMSIAWKRQTGQYKQINPAYTVYEKCTPNAYFHLAWKDIKPLAEIEKLQRVAAPKEKEHKLLKL